MTTPAIAAQLWTFHDLAARDLEGVLTKIDTLFKDADEVYAYIGKMFQIAVNEPSNRAVWSLVKALQSPLFRSVSE